MADLTISEAHLRNCREWAAFNLPVRLRSLHEAVETGLITSKVMYRDTDSLQIDSGHGCVVVIFDAIDSTGPDDFDAKLLGDLVKEAAAVVAVTVFDVADPYTMAVETAVKTGQVVLLAETSDRWAGVWLNLSKQMQGDGRWLLWSPPVAGRA